MPALPIPASLQKSIDATKVEYVQLGKSGLKVSSPILGTMGMGSKEWQGWVMEEEEGMELLKAAWDRGTVLPLLLTLFPPTLYDRKFFLSCYERGLWLSSVRVKV